MAFMASDGTDAAVVSHNEEDDVRNVFENCSVMFLRRSVRHRNNSVPNQEIFPPLPES